MAISLQLLVLGVVLVGSVVHGGGASQRRCSDMDPEVTVKDKRYSDKVPTFRNDSKAITMCHENKCTTYTYEALENRYNGLMKSPNARSSSGANLFFSGKDGGKCCETELRYTCPTEKENTDGDQCWIIQWPSLNNDGRCQVLAEAGPCKKSKKCKGKNKCMAHKRIVSLLAWCPFTNPWPASFGFYFFEIDSHCKCASK